MKSLGSILLLSTIVCVSCVQREVNKVDAGDAAARVEVSRTQLPLPRVVGTPGEPVEVSNCPEDMVEVEGDYCPEVEQTCIKVDKTIHNVNGYVKCDEFAPTKCKSKKLIHMHFCIDRYEWPNKKNVKPAVMVTWNDMNRECSSLGKRLCVDHEWSLSCEGPQIYPYPYGLTRDSNACNIDHPQKSDADIGNMSKANVEYLWQGVSSGSMDKCVSPYGVHDMTGNVDESVVNSAGKPYKSAEMGGHWVLGARNRCRPMTVIHNEDFAFYEIGGRCCKDVP